MKLAKISERSPPLAERTPPRRAVEEGRARCRWTGNSLLHLIKPFLAEFPSAVDHGIDVCVAVHCLSWRCHLDSTLRTQSMQRAVCKQWGLHTHCTHGGNRACALLSATADRADRTYRGRAVACISMQAPYVLIHEPLKRDCEYVGLRSHNLSMIFFFTHGHVFYFFLTWVRLGEFLHEISYVDQ